MRVKDSRGSREHRGGSFETAQPNHTKKNTLLGFDIVFLPAGHRKPGSGLSKPGFVGLYQKLRSPWSRADFLQRNSEITIKIRLGFAVYDGLIREAALDPGGVVLKMQSLTTRKKTRCWASTLFSCLRDIENQALDFPNQAS